MTQAWNEQQQEAQPATADEPSCFHIAHKIAGRAYTWLPCPMPIHFEFGTDVRNHGLVNGLIRSPKGWYGIVRLATIVAILPDLTYVEEHEQSETFDLRYRSCLAHAYTDDKLQRGCFVNAISTGYLYLSTGEIAHVRNGYIAAVTPQKVFHRFLEFERLLHALADKPQIGRFVVDAPDGKLDMPGDNDGVAIISRERATHFFHTRAEYDEY
jgi:hypothetical protein